MKVKNVIPGFRQTLSFTVGYVGLLVLIPLSTLVFKTATMGLQPFVAAVTEPRVVAALGLSFGASLAGALINLCFGALLAWVLVRYRFPGREVIDLLIDLPLALPTAVAGIALTTIYSPNGIIGGWLAAVGIHAAFSRLGIVIALTFIGLPFVVRTLQPVLEDLDADMEEAAASLGATRWQTITQVILPAVTPALISGLTLAFARGLGEYGSVVFIAGNMPMRTEIAPLVIITKLEQYDYAGATAIALVMLTASFLLLLLINWLQGRTLARHTIADKGVLHV